MKSKRQSVVIEIIESQDIETQEELAEMLKQCGFEVTQATVSRDIRELKLTKISTENGKQKYSILSESREQITDRQKRVFKEGVTSINAASNIMVIKTLVGMANAVAASLDAMDHKEVIGTIAGDDTIFSILKTEQDVFDLIEKLNKI